MFRPATKRGAKLRCAIYGPSGSGKTFSALRIASGIGGRIALIDTERGSASKYADRFRFDVADLADRSVESYIKAISEASSYSVLIIDSLSHAWRELLEEIDRVGVRKGNRWAGWSVGTPKQKRFIDAILGSPLHVIATMRSETEWQTSQDGGKVRPVRIGLKPEQGKGIEFEFDLLLEIDAEHCAQVVKDRTSRYQDKAIEKPGEDFGRDLAAWLSTNETLPSPVLAGNPQDEPGQHTASQPPTNASAQSTRF